MIYLVIQINDEKPKTSDFENEMAMRQFVDAMYKGCTVLPITENIFFLRKKEVIVNE